MQNPISPEDGVLHLYKVALRNLMMLSEHLLHRRFRDFRLIGDSEGHYDFVAEMECEALEQVCTSAKLFWGLSFDEVDAIIQSNLEVGVGALEGQDDLDWLVINGVEE